MTLYEKLVTGTKEDMVNEFVLAINWARELSKKDWYNVTHDISGRGLERLVKEILESDIKERIEI